MAIVSELQLIVNKKDVSVEKYSMTQDKLRIRNADLSQILSNLGPEVLLCYVSEEDAISFFNFEISEDNFGDEY